MAQAHRSVRIEALDNRIPSLPAPTRRGRLILHAADLRAADIAQLEQFLAQASGWELILMDRTGEPCLAQQLVGPPHVYWWPGPLTLEQAARLFHPPRPRDSATLPEAEVHEGRERKPAETQTARRNSPLHFSDPDEELGAIQAILATPLEDVEADWQAEDWDASPLSADFEDEPEGLDPFDFEDLPDEHASLEADRGESYTRPPVADPFALEPSGQPEERQAAVATSKPMPTSEHPVDRLLRSLSEGPTVSLEQALAEEEPFADEEINPAVDWQQMPWYKGQIADLNDLAQRLHLDLFALEDDASLQGHSIAMALREDVARLSQFARTLGFLAAPPAQGNQTFSLATLVQEQISTLAGLGPEAPRFLFRGQAQAEVRSDKMLVVSALDALLQVAGQCAGKHPETVRIECSVQQGHAVIQIGFQQGPIAHFTPEEVFEPYALRACLTDIGPNALSAARSIIQSQGGDLILDKPAGEPCTFVLTLPLASL
jgi:hypothetical protein